MSSLFIRCLVNLVSLKIAQTYKWNSPFLFAYKSPCKLLTFLMTLASLPLSLHLRVMLDIHWQWLLLRKGGVRKVHQQWHPWPCLASTTYRVKPPKNLVKALPFTPHLRVTLVFAQSSNFQICDDRRLDRSLRSWMVLLICGPDRS